MQIATIADDLPTCLGKIPTDMLAGFKSGQEIDYHEFNRKVIEPGLTHKMELYIPSIGRSVKFLPGHVWLGDKYGPVKSKVMVIGKYPGVEERNNNRNFIGPSGTLLANTLSDVGVDDFHNWYVTNVVKACLTSADANNKSIFTSFVKFCRAWLEQELSIVEPEYVICLGVDAARSVGIKGRLSDEINSIINVKLDIDGKEIEFKTICLYHPADVLRSPEKYAAFKAGVSLLKSEMAGTTGGNRIENKLFETIVVSNEQDLKESLREIEEEDQYDAVAIDSEWSGRDPSCHGSYMRTIQLCYKPGKVLVVKLTSPGGIECFSPDTDTAFRLLADFFTKSRKRIVGHNIKADIRWLDFYLSKFGVQLSKLCKVPEDGEDNHGYIKTRTSGFFDTLIATHAVYEDLPEYGLKYLANTILGYERYDVDLRKWISSNKNSSSDNDQDDDSGFGNCPDEILIPYGAADADVTFRLYLKLNGEWLDNNNCRYQGLLDLDPFTKMCCRKPFWYSMRANLAFYECEKVGMAVDVNKALDIYKAVSAKREDLLSRLRNEIKWPDFNPNSHIARSELLFGENYNGGIRRRPQGAISLYLEPVKTTGKPSVPWQTVKMSNDISAKPSTDSEVLGILSAKNELVGKLRDISFLDQVLRYFIPAPSMFIDGEPYWDKGFMKYAYKDPDGTRRIHCTYLQTLETGRNSSFKPNVQNLGKKRDKDYKRILGDRYVGPIRSIIVPSKGYLLVEADFIGAELAVAAWLSNDKTMIDHVERMKLPEDSEDHYDIHSRIACSVFNITNCPPTKSGLKSIGKEYLRLAAKSVIFGYMYDQQIDGMIRKMSEEGINVERKEAEAIRNEFIKTYPRLNDFRMECAEVVDRIGWMSNCFGRIRRFKNISSNDDWIIGSQKRQAMNFPIQSTIADCLHISLYNLMKVRDEMGLNYRIINCIHDAVLLEVPEGEVDIVKDKVIPECMTNRLEIPMYDIYGNPMVENGKQLKYRLGCDITVYKRWGSD